jgi:predicted AAA+ superfamily ATPase
MPHQRSRHALPHIKKLAALWPAVGVLGPRQSGKSTLLRDQLGVSKVLTLDDEDVREDALNSAKVFLGRHSAPMVIDEVQKAPLLFDAIKAAIDRKRRPGSYFLTGSSEFSSRIGVRESLTGRIGLLRLYPLTLAEIHKEPLREPSARFSPDLPRFSIETFSATMARGGLPMPFFLRDAQAFSLYWQGWIDTTVHRDIARFFKRSYDPRITQKILRIICQRAVLGEMTEVGDLTGIQRRTALSYLEAMAGVFLVDRISCHDLGVGKDQFALFDSGLLNFLCGDIQSEGMTLSLARTAIRNELLAGREYAGRRLQLYYFKSSRGSVVDFVLDGVPIKVVTKAAVGKLGWDKRALQGAMKTLGSKHGYLAAPVDLVQRGEDGVHIVPWSYWS